MARTRKGDDVRLESSRSTHRGTRAPKHPFQIQLAPFEITPFFLAPVLAGETLKTMMVQARFLSARIKNRLVGWWLETYFFYCPISVLPGAATMRAAIVDPTQSWAGLNDATVRRYFYHAHTGKPSWARECIQPIVRAYFRDHLENWDSDLSTVTGLSRAGLVGRCWSDSLTNISDVDLLTADEGYARIGRTPDGSPTITGDMDTWDEKWIQYQALRRAKLTVATYEEYLAMHGVSTPPLLRETESDFKIPELLRYTRDWTYPVQAVEPSDASVKGLVMWNVADRLTKGRFFSEPGFLIGLALVRPKMYLGRQDSNASDVLLNSTEAWMPPQFDQDPHTALVQYDSVAADTIQGTGPMFGAANDYIVDLRDLYLHGDQWVTHPLDAVRADTALGGLYHYALDLPNVTAGTDPDTNIRYPSENSVGNLFNATPTNLLQLEADGVVSLQIASRITKDATG